MNTQETKLCWQCQDEIPNRRYGGECEQCQKIVCTDCSVRCDGCWLRWCNDHDNPFEYDRYGYPHCKTCQKSKNPKLHKNDF